MDEEKRSKVETKDRPGEAYSNQSGLSLFFLPWSLPIYPPSLISVCTNIPLFSVSIRTPWEEEGESFDIIDSSTESAFQSDR